MIRTHFRSAEERDFSAVTRGKGSLGRNLLFISLPLSVFLFALAYVVWRSWIAGTIVATVAFVASAVSNLRFFANVRRRKASLADGKAVEVTEVEASRVLDIEPLGSHGPALVFFGAGGKALLLVGQWLLDYRSFPSTSFRLYRWTDDRKPIRIETTGTRLKPEPSTVQLRPTYRLTDIEIFQGTPETLQQDLDRALGNSV